MSRRTRIRNIGLAVVLVAGASAAAVHFVRKPAATPTPHYTAYKVTRGDLSKVVMTTGQLAPLISVEVSTQISGLITEVKVDFNTPVKKGQILALIDPSTYQQALNQAGANLKSAEATNTLARITVDRQKKLVASGFVTEDAYDQALALFEQSQAALLTQQALVRSAELDLQRCTITSPIDGIVIYKSADVGKTVQASFSAPTLFVIAEDLRKMQIIASLSEVDVWSVKPGQEATFTIEALPDRTFHGILKQIRNPYTPSEKQASQPQTSTSPIATFDAVIEVDNSDLVLLPSLSANVSVIVSEHKKILKVPNSALRVQIPPKDGVKTDPGSEEAPAVPTPDLPKGSAVVYRFPKGDRNATPEKVIVHPGITDSIMTEIESGLDEGDTVVTGTTRAPYTYRSPFF